MNKILRNFFAFGIACVLLSQFVFGAIPVSFAETEEPESSEITEIQDPIDISFGELLDSVNFDRELLSEYEFSVLLEDPTVIYPYRDSFLTEVASRKQFRTALENSNCSGFFAVQEKMGGEFHWSENGESKTGWIEAYYADRILTHCKTIPTLFDSEFTILSAYVVDAHDVHGATYVCLVTDQGDFVYTDGYLFPAEHFYDFAEFTVAVRNPDADGSDTLHYSCYVPKYERNSPLTLAEYTTLLEEYDPPSIPTPSDDPVTDSASDRNDAGDGDGTMLLVGIGAAVCVIAGVAVAFLIFRKRRKMKQS